MSMQDGIKHLVFLVKSKPMLAMWPLRLRIFVNTTDSYYNEGNRLDNKLNKVNPRKYM